MPDRPAISTRSSKIPRGFRRAFIFIARTIAALLCIQNFILSFLLLGWITRVSQRFVFRAWWKRSKIATWQEFVAADSATGPHMHWPALLFRDHATPAKWFSALLRNTKIGLQAFFNTSVILGPACALWIFSWYDGWNNSFNKGYEQAIVGPATGFAGVFLFIAAMFYLPLAQMRHAATGDWRTFYQFRLVWRLIRRRWLQCLGLAMVISALSVPVMVLKTAPNFFTAMKEDKAAATEKGFTRLRGGDAENLSPKQALANLKSYYAWCALYLLPALLLVRLAAARVYAGAILDSVQSGAIAEDALHENEWRALSRLDLLIFRPSPPRRKFIRLLTWAGTKVGAATVGFAMFLVYFSLVAQVYVGEFLHKNDRAQGWWNQPLVQLPYFNYVPGRLVQEAGQP